MAKTLKFTVYDTTTNNIGSQLIVFTIFMVHRQLSALRVFRSNKMKFGVAIWCIFKYGQR